MNDTANSDRSGVDAPRWLTAADVRSPPHESSIVRRRPSSTTVSRHQAGLGQPADPVQLEVDRLHAVGHRGLDQRLLIGDHLVEDHRQVGVLAHPQAFGERRAGLLHEQAVGPLHQAGGDDRLLPPPAPVGVGEDVVALTGRLDDAHHPAAVVAWVATDLQLEPADAVRSLLQDEGDHRVDVAKRHGLVHREMVVDAATEQVDDRATDGFAEQVPACDIDR